MKFQSTKRPLILFASALAALAVATPAYSQAMKNAALASLGATVFANSEYDPPRTAAQIAIDGSTNNGVYWLPQSGVTPWMLTVTLRTNLPIARINLVEDWWDPAFSTVGKIEYFDGANWQTMRTFSKSSPGLDFTLSTPITTKYLRFNCTACVSPPSWAAAPGVIEFEAYAVMPQITGPDDQQVPIGQTASFTAQVAQTNVWPVSLQWLFNGVQLHGMTNSTLILPAVTKTNEGSYSVTAKYGPFQYNSKSARLSVLDFYIQIYTAVELNFTSTNGVSYQIQTSSNLVDWAAWGNPIIGTGQTMQQFISTKTNNTYRYFRVNIL
jgi:hypothetical protein